MLILTGPTHQTTKVLFRENILMPVKAVKGFCLENPDLDSRWVAQVF
jgi:hypothetical protein